MGSKKILALILWPSLIFVFNPNPSMPFSDTATTFACINANSLNMSQAAKWNQMLKVYGIVKLKTDVIFVSDVRLSNKNLISSRNEIVKLLRSNPYEKYEMATNSTKNKRGVAIL
jgi:hypothetical protein